VNEFVLPKCEVCQLNDSIGVACSALGPVSMAFCKTCLEKNAESVGMIEYTLDACGGPDDVADWVKQLKTYKDGQYLTWDEYMKVRTS